MVLEGERQKAQADQALNPGCEKKRKPMPKTESNFGAKMSMCSALYKSSFGIFWTY